MSPRDSPFLQSGVDSVGGEPHTVEMIQFLDSCGFNGVGIESEHSLVA